MPKAESSVPDRRFVEESLKRISVELIQAHKDGNIAVLAGYARASGLAKSDARPGKLFMKLIHIFHPDRIESFMDRVRSCAESGDTKGLAEINAMLGARAAARPSGRSKTAASTTDANPFEAEGESYGFRPEDFGFAENSWEDHAVDQETRDEKRAARRIDFMEALRREYFGNLELEISRNELEELEGDLDLFDHGIEELDGIQLCRNLTGLNLSLNSIYDISPLRYLRRLVTLDLSGNEIEDADELERLVRLEELDLSDNEIEDFAFLENLPRLRVVNVQGNPIRKTEILDRLRASGVVVLS